MEKNPDLEPDRQAWAAQLRLADQDRKEEEARIKADMAENQVNDRFRSQLQELDQKNRHENETSSYKAWSWNRDPENIGPPPPVTPLSVENEVKSYYDRNMAFLPDDAPERAALKRQQTAWDDSRIAQQRWLAEGKSGPAPAPAHPPVFLMGPPYTPKVTTAP